MKGDLLNEKHPLYSALISENPEWWAIAKSDPELYIDVRKDNKIDIYYRGGRMAGIERKRNGEISVTAHPKYVGYTDEDKKNPTIYRKRKDKYGKDNYDAIYQDCRDWIVNRLLELKENIVRSYSGESEGEDTSEKFIQGNLVINNRNLYLDTEFAHRFREGERLTIRIDLVKIVDGRLTFVELKRIGDNRLLSRDGKPEILTQMSNYREFIKYNQVTLLNYYKKLYRIKKHLGLPVPPVDDIDNLAIDLEPVLLIALNYDNISTSRNYRIQGIKDVLMSIGITPEFM